ncbi:MAG: hypothetical protein E6Z83_14375 [Pantoea sp.]|uniref:hypothetical protein n=1 Tax=Pantoea TaxID=53335 RepID=UPI00117E4893|nr:MULTISPECIES: hypothetical protein [Pantoea]MDU5781975.1 hypothetical protein [Pantoea sp.]
MNIDSDQFKPKLTPFSSHFCQRLRGRRAPTGFISALRRPGATGSLFCPEAAEFSVLLTG